MIKILALFFVLGNISVFASDCDIMPQKKATKKQLRILSKKYNIVQRSAKLGYFVFSNDCNEVKKINGKNKSNDCQASISLLNDAGYQIELVTGKRGGNKIKAITNAIKELPQCI